MPKECLLRQQRTWTESKLPLEPKNKNKKLETPKPKLLMDAEKLPRTLRRSTLRKFKCRKLLMLKMLLRMKTRSKPSKILLTDFRLRKEHLLRQTTGTPISLKHTKKEFNKRLITNTRKTKELSRP
jgi:hypothetical protein